MCAITNTDRPNTQRASRQLKQTQNTNKNGAIMLSLTHLLITIWSSFFSQWKRKIICQIISSNRCRFLHLDLKKRFRAFKINQSTDRAWRWDKTELIITPNFYCTSYTACSDIAHSTDLCPSHTKHLSAIWTWIPALHIRTFMSWGWDERQIFPRCLYLILLCCVIPSSRSPLNTLQNQVRALWVSIWLLPCSFCITLVISRAECP